VSVVVRRPNRVAALGGAVIVIVLVAFAVHGTNSNSKPASGGSDSVIFTTVLAAG